MSEKGFHAFNLSNQIVKALDSLEYKNPTEVQNKVIPLVLEKIDLVVKSQTGSGKTASYGIPICELVEWEENKPQALILTPTRELAVQVKDDFIDIGRLKRIKATAVYGKQPFAIQKTELKQKTHVVVGTPGRVLDHIERGTLTLEKVNYLVIDEADEMLNMGFIEQVEAIIKALPKKRVTMLFSATLPEAVKELSQRYMKTPIDIEIKANGLTTDKIDHTLIKVDEKEKFSLLQAVTIVQNPDSCIIFCRTKDRVDMLSDQLTDLGYNCDQIHGGMVQEDRLDVMNDFKRGEFRYLIATDVAARGIDIDNITHVINYDIPLEKESYVHRTGRTGRAGKKGRAITFMTPFEEKFLQEIEEYIGFKIPIMAVPTEEEIADKRSDFEVKKNIEPAIKKAKNEKLNKHIMKLYFNGGKKKKLRAVDFVGTIAKIDGVSAEDIGIITIMDTFSYVEILNDKGRIVLEKMKNTPIKGKSLKVYEAKKD
ncbi:ATP-dependent helicase [Niallia circulans]|jgi:ATP-dependent RNA helicase DeaD|uniref:ATP-dependent RNA helicase DbpA n=1 Tax=Niallia circulans TaxID=1397 RepID=A0A268FFR9_NIACI|nr:DEAD/DEAH box helicase [Niallia circulans]AYV68633.1 ATP-dependent helicase [Niallia circulans]AYV72973.1 ATP-dependent helicase [Niallia circulans]PAD84199.1 RNA helicase [Niallia circulans]